MDEGFQSVLSKCTKDFQSLIDSFFSTRSLLVTIHHAIWPITQDALLQLFSPYRSMQKITPFQKSIGVHFSIQYQGYGAIAARSSLQCHNIYDKCCQLDIQLWDDAKKQESELSGINDNKVLDELLMKTDGKSDGLDKPKKGPSDEDSTKILLELPKSKAQNFEGCDDMIKWLLKPSLFQGMGLNPLREDENNCHQTCQFKQLENTIENVVEGHGSGVKSREWNPHAQWITPIDIENHKTSLLPHRQGVAGIAIIHNVKFQLLDNNDFVESEDPYRFRYIVDGEGEMKQRSWTMAVGLHDCEKIGVERMLRSCDVSINSIFTPMGDLDVKIGGDVVLQDDFSEGIFEMELEDVDDIVSDNEQWRRAEVEKHDKNLQNLKSSFDTLDTFVHPYGTIQPMNKCTDTNRIGMLYGDKQGKRYQIWLDCISISQIGSDSWLMKFSKWESTAEDRYCCLTTVLLTTKQVEESFTWLHIHQIWLDNLEAKGEHKNGIHSYSWDHKIEVENFKEISLIWDKIYGL
ncbi:hypothetical protein GQ457_11G028730 [Hibiscus cannabinus]